MTSIPTFATRPTFLGLERSNADAAICIAGIPFDLGTSNRPGARFGPAAIRQASRMLVDGDHPASWAEIEKMDLADVGERQGRGINPMDGMRAVDQHAARLADRRRAEARAAAVGGAEVERNAGDRDGGVSVAARQTKKCRRNRVGRRRTHGALGNAN